MGNVDSAKVTKFTSQANRNAGINAGPMKFTTASNVSVKTDII